MLQDFLFSFTYFRLKNTRKRIYLVQGIFCNWDI